MEEFCVFGYSPTRRVAVMAHADRCRLVRQQLGFDRRIVSKRALHTGHTAGHAIDRITNPETRNALTHRLHHTRQVYPQHCRKRVPCMACLPGANFDIKRIHAAGMNPHQHLTSLRLWPGQSRGDKCAGRFMQHHAPAGPGGSDRRRHTGQTGTDHMQCWRRGALTPGRCHGAFTHCRRPAQPARIMSAILGRTAAASGSAWRRRCDKRWAKVRAAAVARRKRQP